MAYITSQQVAEMRKEIKASFPKTFKFSITTQNSSRVCVQLMESPLEIDAYRNREIKNHKTIVKIISCIINKNNFDHSDSMTDYFHVGHYTSIEAGKWDKPYNKIN